jgi:hypothetical protein
VNPERLLETMKIVERQPEGDCGLQSFICLRMSAYERMRAEILRLPPDILDRTAESDMLEFCAREEAVAHYDARGVCSSIAAIIAAAAVATGKRCPAVAASGVPARSA